MAATVKITGLKQLQAKLKRLERIDYTDVGEVIKNKMISVIDANRKRPKKQASERMGGEYILHIEDVLHVEKLSRGVGVGDIDVLNQQVPYWKIVNDGGYVPPPTTGVFTDGRAKRGGAGNSFVFAPGGPKMKPKKPIPAMKYIEKTMAWANRYLPKLIGNKIVKEFKDFRASSLISIR